MSTPFNFLFDQSAFDRDDLRARCAASGWLVTRGYQVESNPDARAIDLIVRKDGVWRANVEVEIRHSAGWRPHQQFPFPTHQTSLRKRWLCQSGNYLWTMNAALTNAIVSPMTGAIGLAGKEPTQDRGYERFMEFPTGAAFFPRLR
jgi:hypothetical protein